jgi:hypothetical protein
MHGDDRNLASADELHDSVTAQLRQSILRLAACTAAGLALAFLLAAPAASRAAAQLSWSAPRAIEGAEGHAIASISCPSSSLCVAVDRTGRVLSGDPLGGSGWNARSIAGAGALDSVSCASAALCVAVDESGQLSTSTDPAGGSWTPAVSVDAHALAGVSCPTASLCVAVGKAGEVLSSGRPAEGVAAAWSPPAHIDGETPLSGVSCTGETLCVAVDAEGGALASGSPATSSSWHSLGFDLTHSLSGVSCGTVALCVADGAGEVFASAQPGSQSPTWTSTAIDSVPLSAISCESAGLCVAVDGGSHTFTSDDASSVLPGWSESSGGPGGSATAISCLSEGRCVAANAAGQSIAGTLPPPALSTGSPTEVAQTAATVSGAVDPQDAPLTYCRFEYGKTSGYGQSVPCSATPGPGSAMVAVSAQIPGLAAASTYHYRLAAGSATGSALGSDGTFTTAAPVNAQLVHPSPYITGVPAVGDRLACNPGVPHSSTASLEYTWWRDGAPIEGAGKQLYRLEPQDASQHLQCEVIATDAAGSASARSAFVAVPAQGVPVSAGETAIGTPRISGGKLQLPVSCSPQAYPECTLQLHLAAVETLRGRKLIAVTARRPAAGPATARRAPRRLAKTRSLKVTLLSRTVKVPAGKQRTVSTALDPVGRRLIAKARRLSAQLTVQGTVIGVLNATLASEQVTFVSPRARAGGRSSVRRASSAALARGSVPGVTAAALSATPYMGFDTYFALGPRLSESAILTQASRMISDGLAKDGYRYLWLDVGWWQGQRNSEGEITVNHAQWPHGMAWLTSTLHRAGLLVGIYTDAGSEGCGGPGQGSYGHYRQDANTLAAWGFDAVKVDFCGGGRMRLVPAKAYASFHAALLANSSHRPMLLSICNFREPGAIEGEPSYGQSAFVSYSFGPSDGNSWRTDTDVGFPGFVTFPWVLRNLDADAAHPEAAGPGHWNDPDYLAPDQGLTGSQFRTQMSMWAILAAPLMASDDLTTVTSASLDSLRDREVIAVDQDPAGIQGKLVASGGEGEVWVKPLYGGDRAVALLNRGAKAQRIATTAAAIGMPRAAGYKLRNVWTHGTSTSSGGISVEVPGESTVLLRVSRS